jgi:Molybdopterin cofactor-binding domain
VPRLLGVFAVGRIVDPVLARSQLAGGMTMSLGMALMEQTEVDQAQGGFVRPVRDLPITPAKLLESSPSQRRRDTCCRRPAGAARAATGELPGTLKRSSKEAQETFTRAHASAVRAYALRRVPAAGKTRVPSTYEVEGTSTAGPDVRANHRSPGASRVPRVASG